MMAYEYLKQDPRYRGSLITQNWRALFDDPACPYAVKQELLEVQALGVPITDSILYFHSAVMLDTLCNGKNARVPFDGIWTCTRLLDMLYSCVMQRTCPDIEQRVFALFYILDKDSAALDLTFGEVKKLLSYMHLDTSREALPIIILRAINLVIDYVELRNIYNARYMVAQVFKLMDTSFIRRCTIAQLENIAALSRDLATGSCKYASMAELARAHDETTEQAVRRQLKFDPLTIIYNVDFETLVKQYGFTLPATRNDMIARGIRHNNCIATYADKHCSFNDAPTHCTDCEHYTRLIYSEDATAELNIETMHGHIVSVTCPQYRGRFNKTYPMPEALTLLRIALTGLPREVLSLTEVYDGKEKDRAANGNA